MADFDPNQPIDSKADADAYVRWCSDQFTEVIGRVQNTDHVPYAIVLRAAQLLYAVTAAPLHLDDDYDRDREQQEENLSRLWLVAYKTERTTGDVSIRDWIVARSVADCYKPVGRFAGYYLDALKCALGALIVWGAHPAEDLAKMHAPDAWALVLYGYDRLTAVGDEAGDEPLGPWDFAVVPNQTFVDSVRWQQLNNSLARMGAPPVSPN